MANPHPKHNLPPNEEINAVHAKWAELWQRVYALMDDAELANYEASKAKVEAIASRKGLKRVGTKCYAVKRLMTEYAEAVMSGMDNAGLKTYLDRAKVTMAEYLYERRFCPEMGALEAYLRKVEDARDELEMRDTRKLAHSGLKELLQDREGECGINPRVVKMALEALDRDRFGQEDRRFQSDRDGRPQVTYNVTGVTINLPEKPSSKKAPKAVEAEVVDAVVGINIGNGGSDGQVCNQ